MDRKLLSKLLAIVLVITLTSANFILLAIYGEEILAASTNYEEQDTSISKTEVSFDAYFVSEEGEKTHTLTTDANNDELKLILSVSLTKGYLKDAVVSIGDSNFKVVETDILPNGVEEINSESNTVTLNQISKDDAVTVEIPIEIVDNELFDLNNFSKDTNITLTGTYVNDSAKEIAVEKTIVVNLSISEDAETYLNAEITQHAIFEEEGETKELIQLTVSSSVVDSLLPIKSTEINIEVPTLYDLEPEYVSVVSTSTRATNGNDGTSFSEENYTYEDGNILISVLNEANENAQVSWVKNETDEYVINLIYNIDDIEDVEIDAENAETEELETIQLNISSTLSLYNNEEKEIDNEISQLIELGETATSVVSLSISSGTSEIAKGYMETDGAPNTEYDEVIEVNIGYNPEAKYIAIDDSEEKYIDINGNEYTATTYYKSIQVSRENLVNILGEDGTIEVISDGICYAVLDADTTSYTFEEEVKDVAFSTSEVIAEGTLVINSEKYIKSGEIETEKVNELDKLIINKETKINGEVVGNEIKEIQLTEPTLQISSDISTHNLSTVVTNENVELRVTLETNNNTTRLYTNPVIEIELPSYIEELNVKSINILYNDELTATSAMLDTNEAGNQVVTIVLEGEQTKYNEITTVNGVTIIMNTDITIENTAPSMEDSVKIRVINQGEETVENEIAVKYKAPTGIITVNSIDGYKEGEEEVASISGEEETGIIEVSAGTVIATDTITIINNNEYTCGEVEILGRTPTEGNTDISTGEDLGSTFTAKMVSQITAIEGIAEEEMTVYYSANSEASRDLTDTSNGWTTDYESIEEVKSYLIVIQKEIAQGEKLVFSYDIEIPEGLEREESTYSTYNVYYTSLEGIVSGIQEVARATAVGVTTGTGVQLDVELEGSVENGADVKEGEVVEYTITVTNTGSVDAENIVVSVDIPYLSYYTTIEDDVNETYYQADYWTDTYTETIESLKMGNSIQITLYLTVGNLVEYTAEDMINRENYDSDEEYQEALEKYEEINQEWFESVNSTDVKVQAIATVEEDGEEITFESKVWTNSKVRGYLQLNLTSDAGNYSLKTGTNITYDLTVLKLGLDTYNNVELICELPEGLTYVSSSYEDTVSEIISGSTIKWSISEFSETEYITLTCEVNEKANNTTTAVSVYGTCDETDEIFTTDELSFTIGEANIIETSHTSNASNGTITEGDDIVYKITLYNDSEFDANNVRVTDVVSDGLMLKSLAYTLGDTKNTYSYAGTTTSNIGTFTIGAYQTLTIEITATSKLLNADEESRIVTNTYTVTGDNFEDVTGTTLQATVVEKVYTYDEDNGTSTAYTISGTAWVDENKNGIRELDEETLSDIPVMLINESGTTITSTITNENGTYTLTGVPEGSYIVVFIYDMSNYDVTSYQVGDASTNNDAVEMTLSIQGESMNCAATNLISVSENKYNIDLGLVVSPKFDLSLTKTISKITVKTSQGTTTNTYNGSTLAKVEIPSSYLSGATVAVEYTITVTNNGAISGYAKRIVDYLSSTDLKFSSELNSDWYQGSDGNLYSSALADTLLEPGESATVTLVLTKTVSESNTGITNNTAEIYEAYNDEGLDDYNSTPGNQTQSENDLGQADIIIGAKTGVAFYIGFVIMVIAIMGLGIYIINKKVINKV